MTNIGWNKYSKKTLKAIKKLAFLLILPNDIAKIIECDSRNFIFDLQNEKTAVYKAFNKGLLKRELNIKKQMSELTDVFERDSIEKELRNYKAKLILQFHG